MPLVPSSDSGSGDVVEQVSIFLRSLEDLSTSVSKNTEALAAVAVQQRTAELQQMFPKLLQLLNEATNLEGTILETTNLEPIAHQRLRTYQTEAHRRVRLLSIEAMKLRTAKQPETLEKVRSQLQEHLDQLTKFIQAIADEIAS